MKENKKTRPQKNAEEKLLAAYLSALKASSEDGKYGFHYFDKPELSDEEDEVEEDPDSFDMHSCPPACCDSDCECDDCVRCSNESLGEGESIASRGVAG